jgi:hypothetical protein
VDRRRIPETLAAVAITLLSSLMIKPTMAQSRLLALVISCGMLAACAAGDAVPTAALDNAALSASGPNLAKAPAPMKDTDSAKYVFVIQPNTSYDLQFGSHRLTIPAGAICDIASSGYGTTTWDAPCTSSSTAVQITAKVHGSSGGYPVIDFEPALRFSPAAEVTLYMYVKHPRQVASNWQILYCATAKACLQEEMPTSFNNADKTVFRRIKHFSGYMVSE